MALEGKQSGVLQQLGVSYHQILDYSSKEYTATLVSSTHHDLQAYRSNSDETRFKSAFW